MRATKKHTHIVATSTAEFGEGAARLKTSISKVSTPSRITVSNMLNSHLQMVVAQGAGQRSVQLTAKLAVIIANNIAGRFIDEIEVDDVERLAVELSRSFKLPTVKSILHLFGAAFAQAIAEGHVHTDPTKPIRAAYRSGGKHPHVSRVKRAGQEG